MGQGDTFLRGATPGACLPGRAVISTGFNGPGPRVDEKKRRTHRAGPENLGRADLISNNKCVQVGYMHIILSTYQRNACIICTKCLLFSSPTAHIVEICKVKIANYSSCKAAYPNALRNVDFRLDS